MQSNSFFLQGGFLVNVHILFQECVCVYMLDGESRMICDEPAHELPKDGKIRCVILCACVWGGGDLQKIKARWL